MTVDKKFLVGADIEKAASSIIRAGSERLVVGEVSNSVDIGLVAGEGLNAAASSDIPEFRGGIAAARDKSETIVAECNGHDISCMADEGGRLLACFDVPESTGHVPARCDNLRVVDKAAAGQISGVTWKLAGHAHGTFFGF